MMVPTMKLNPGASLGPFVLGLTINEVFGILSTSFSSSTGCSFMYSEANPLQFDFVLDVAGLGIRLGFDSVSQRLKLIIVRNLQGTILSYRNAVFSSPSVTPNLKSVVDIFGPTKPGKLINDVYELSYPGMCMHFTIHKDFLPKLRGDHDLPSNITAPVSRIYVFRGDNYKFPKILHCPPLKDAQNRRGSFSVKRQEYLLAGPKPPTTVKFHQGISNVQNGIELEDEDSENPEDFIKLRVDVDCNVHFCTLGQVLGLGSHAQDVMSILGKPEGVYTKERDHVAIYREAAGDDMDTDPSVLEPAAADYFYNYFSAGIDILFDGRHHRAKKFVFHTNFPGHPDFNVYHKCQFQLEVPTERELRRPPEVKEVQETVGDLLGYPEFAPMKKVQKRKRVVQEKILVSPNLRWEDVKRELGVTSSSPLILGRASHMNPFGSTLAYGHGNYIFEVMKNGHIASVTVFDETE